MHRKMQRQMVICVQKKSFSNNQMAKFSTHYATYCVNGPLVILCYNNLNILHRLQLAYNCVLHIPLITYFNL